MEINKGFAFEKNHTWFWDEFPVDYVLNYPVNKFKIYVSDLKYFNSNLPELDTTINQQVRNTKQDKFDMSQHYYASLVGAYVASYVCGISIKHLTPSPEIPNQITSFLHFLIYFTIHRITRELQDAVGSIVGQGDEHRVGNAVGINRSANNEARNKILQNYKADKLQEHFPDFHGRIADQKNDFKKFIAKKSDGIMSTGLILLNHSIEAYIYAILGSQSQTRQSIVGNCGSALETQVVFRQIVEDSIINYDTSTWIQNMNLAISDTNVVLDIAISPSLWLLPSNMII